MELRTTLCSVAEHAPLSPTAARLLEAVTTTLRSFAANKLPHLILGLSGGIDSIALFHTLVAARSRGMLTFSVAHVDHEWRPESGEDRLFCEQISQKHDVPFHTTTLRELVPLIPSHKLQIRSKEALAREARLIYFKHILTLEQGDAITLAHHEDDQIETFFIRLIRGAHIGGLAGMEPMSLPFIRPFLTLPKALLQTFVNEHNFAYRTDSSNEDRTYLRNKIRLDLIPAFLETDRRARGALLETLTTLRETSDTLDTLRDQALHSITENTHHYRLDHYRTLTSALRKSILLKLLITHGAPFTPHTGLLSEGERFLLQKAGGRHILGSSIVLVKEGKYFYFEAHSPGSPRPAASRPQ